MGSVTVVIDYAQPQQLGRRSESVWLNELDDSCGDNERCSERRQWCSESAAVNLFSGESDTSSWKLYQSELLVQKD